MPLQQKMAPETVGKRVPRFNFLAELCGKDTAVTRHESLIPYVHTECVAIPVGLYQGNT